MLKVAHWKATKACALVAVAAMHAMVEEHVPDLATKQRDDLGKVPKERIMGVLKGPRDLTARQLQGGPCHPVVDDVCCTYLPVRAWQIMFNMR